MTFYQLPCVVQTISQTVSLILLFPDGVATCTFVRLANVLDLFVNQRLLPDSTGNLHDPIPQNKSKTFVNLTNVHVATPSGKSKIYDTMNYHQHP